MFKKALLLLLFVMGSMQQMQAQVWIEVAGKVNWGLTMLYNKSIFDDNSHKYNLNTGLAYGGRLGLNFGEFHGLSVEALLSKNRQLWNYQTVDAAGVVSKFENRVDWKNIDLYLLYRYLSERSYVEIGPSYSIVRGVNWVDSKIHQSSIDASTGYNKGVTSAVLGFGGFIAGSDVFSLNLGFRVSYALTDFVSDAGQTLSFPNPNRTPSTAYDSYKKTLPLTAQVGLELNFGIGEYARANCGRRGFIFSFDE